jgi:protein tyrosine phosphatase
LAVISLLTNLKPILGEESQHIDGIATSSSVVELRLETSPNQSMCKIQNIQALSVEHQITAIEISVTVPPQTNLDRNRSDRHMSSASLSVVNRAPCQKPNEFNQEFSVLLDYDNSLKRNQHTHFSTSLQYQKKNRWTEGGFEVYANENTRIKLPTNEVFQYDYINANFITKSAIGSSCDYIATQAPMSNWVDGSVIKEDTMSDFWNMIWQYDVPVVMMLAKLIEEEGRIKAHQYWPNLNEVVTFESRDNCGDLQVRGVREYLFENDQDIIIREMLISHGGTDRIIHQVHFMGWPDNSVPTLYDGFNRLIRASNIFMRDDRGPMTIHCSAGVGRTGTFICIHSMLQRLMEHKDSGTTEPFEYNFFEIVMALKQMRWQLVYNAQQYEFCYRGTSYIVNNGARSGRDEH